MPWIQWICTHARTEATGVGWVKDIRVLLFMLCLRPYTFSLCLMPYAWHMDKYFVGTPSRQEQPLSTCVGYICVLIRLYMRPHTTIYRQNQKNLSYMYMCPHTAIYASSYVYIPSKPEAPQLYLWRDHCWTRARPRHRTSLTACIFTEDIPYKA